MLSFRLTDVLKMSFFSDFGVPAGGSAVMVIIGDRRGSGVEKTSGVFSLPSVEGSLSDGVSKDFWGSLILLKKGILHQI